METDLSKNEMETGLSDNDWSILLSRIVSGKCTPLLGAGASSDHIDNARKIAEKWAIECEQPLEDRSDLARVTQYIAIINDDVVPKEKMAELCKNAGLPNYENSNQIHRLLADLKLPLYITTNYDDFMYRALIYRGIKEEKIKREICRWNPLVDQLEDG